MPLTSNRSRTSDSSQIRGRCQKTKQLWQRLRYGLLRFTAGGRWTDRLHPETRRNLRWFWFDGLFVSAGDAILVSYLTLYILALGASPAQIGLLSSLANIGAAMVLIPGASLVERLGHRKPIVLISGRGATRPLMLLLILLPFLFEGPALVYVAIGLAILRSSLAYLGVPAWTSLSADIVPIAWRGRYFSARNTIMGLSNMAATFVAGQIITWAGGVSGYQWALGLSIVLGLGSTACYSRINEPAFEAAPQQRGRRSLRATLNELRSQHGFLAFAGAAALLSFSLNIAGPFFNVYLVEKLGATASVIGTLAVFGSLAALPGQRIFGSLVDRWGGRRVQVVSGLIIPLLPLAWLVVRSPWHVLPIRIVGGFAWAGYNLASFSMLLDLTPEDRRPRLTALHQMALTIATAAGAALGGIVAEISGSYQIVFLLSGIGRLLAILLYILLVPAPADASPSSAEASEEGEKANPIEEG